MRRFVFGHSKTKTFIAVFDTTKVSSGSSANNQIKLSFSFISSVIIDWGDGFITDGSILTHTYSVSGIYIIKIKGKIQNFAFYNSGDRLKILKILNWGETTYTTQYDTFSGCNNLTLDEVEGIPTLNTNSLIRFFLNCHSLKTINNFDKWKTIGNYADGRSMFQNCYLYNDPNISNCLLNFNSLGVTFSNCYVFNQPINWGFYGGANDCFQNCYAFNQDISHWNFNKNSFMLSFLGGKTASNYNAQYLANLYIRCNSLFVGTGRTQANKVWNNGTIKYHSSGAVARASLVADGWIITDGGML